MHVPPSLIEAAAENGSGIGWAFPTPVDVISVIVTASIALIAAGYALYQRRSTNLHVIADLHRELTTGEVAEARHTIGTFFYAPPKRRNRIDDGQLTKSYYQLCWAIERVSNVITAHSFSVSFESDTTQRPFNRKARQEKATVGLGWSVEEILRNIARLHVHESKRLGLNDVDVQKWLTTRLDKRLRDRYKALLSEV